MKLLLRKEKLLPDSGYSLLGKKENYSSLKKKSIYKDQERER